MKYRSGCPINLTLEVLGDSWSLIVLRDIMFGDRRSYRELLAKSEEGIASNVLSARLKHLVSTGLLTRAADPTHRQRVLYSLTESSIELVPVMAALGAWGRKHLPATPTLSARARALEEGALPLWAAFMDELRVRHLGASISVDSPTALEQLAAAYEEALLAEQARTKTGNGGSEGL